jgi:hypothetical protein
VIFDAPPGPKSGRYVRTETDQGANLAGFWVEGDGEKRGLWLLKTGPWRVVLDGPPGKGRFVELEDAYGRGAPSEAGVWIEGKEWALELDVAWNADELDVLKEAVAWVLNDAGFKAPEQIGVVAERWIDRLQDAMDRVR